MRHEHAVVVDLIDELRMRAWARANHVPTDQRPDSWHPIVLDEMSRKDLDTVAWTSDDSGIGSAYVPVVPTNVYVVHPGHTGTDEPRINRNSSLTERYVVG